MMNTKLLQDTIQGQYYSEALLIEAAKMADTAEVKLLLIALRYGYPINTHSRMALQDFVARLDCK